MVGVARRVAVGVVRVGLAVGPGATRLQKICIHLGTSRKRHGHGSSGHQSRREVATGTPRGGSQRALRRGTAARCAGSLRCVVVTMVGVITHVMLASGADGNGGIGAGQSVVGAAPRIPTLAPQPLRGNHHENVLSPSYECVCGGEPEGARRDECAPQETRRGNEPGVAGADTQEHVAWFGEGRRQGHR